MDVAAIEVSHASSGISPAAEQAALLYANGLTPKAVDTLLSAICRGGPAHNDPEVWCMLADLFAAQGMVAEYDRLTLDFAAKFERMPPVRKFDARPSSELPEALRTGGGRYFLISGNLDAGAKVHVDRIDQAMRESGLLRIEVGKLQGVAPEGCKLLVDLLQASRKRKREIIVTGAPHLIGLLRGTIESGQKPESHSMWTLLFELLQRENLQDAFEDLSLDYAMAFEVSPPPWNPPPAGAAATQSALKQAEASGAPRETDSFCLIGEVAGGRPVDFEELRTYAAPRNLVVIDLARVTRVDFATAAVFLNVLMDLRRKGKRVLIIGANTLVTALFAIVGIDGVAALSRGS